MTSSSKVSVLSFPPESTFSKKLPHCYTKDSTLTPQNHLTRPLEQMHPVRFFTLLSTEMVRMKRHFSPTMYSMLLAGGLTDDRALLCSCTHSSMNFPSVISGSESEHTPGSRIIQVHKSTTTTTTTVPMLQYTNESTEAAVCGER